MNAKTYNAKTIQEALDQIKRELGPEAVILSTQSIMKRRAFGLIRGQNWEITAAGKDAPPAAEAKPNAPALEDKVTLKTTSVPAPPHASAQEQVPRVASQIQHSDMRIEELLDQVSELKRAVRLIGKAMPNRAQDMGGVYAELVGQGVDPEIADQLAAKESQGSSSPAELRDR